MARFCDKHLGTIGSGPHPNVHPFQSVINIDARGFTDAIDPPV